MSLRESKKKILITGAYGFIGKNLVQHLIERKDVEIIKFGRGDSINDLENYVFQSDIIYHLAGENRPKAINEYDINNNKFTEKLCKFIKNSEKKIKLIFASSIQAEIENPYGVSKKNAEEHILKLYKSSKGQVYIYRLENVFGKWCKPNYNSVVSTFCFNLINNVECKINQNDKELKLLYIDDVIQSFISIIDDNNSDSKIDRVNVYPKYEIKLIELFRILSEFKNNRDNLNIDDVGSGIKRALYSTFLSYLPTGKFLNGIITYEDERGKFAEILKTKKSGQVSYFTCEPGVTRGNHYHHTKNERFLVVSGMARFNLKNIITNERCEINVNGKEPVIIETVPGWAHNIENIGTDLVIVILWANEIFDNNNADTYTYEI